jgi:nicotinamidase/pyrazinamidase
MKALIIVDMQNDFVEGGALAVPGGLDLVPIINGLQEDAHGGYDLIVATQDWHPANHGSFAANHPGKNPGDLIQLNGLPQVLWPVHCVQNTCGADFIPGLHRERWAAIFQKGTDPEIDSYSGFFDNGKRRATGLGDFLRERGVVDVHVVGLATDYCVKFTALDAVALGFTTKLVANASCGVDLNPGDTKRAVEEMQRAGVQLYFAMNHGWQGQAGDEWLIKMGMK